MKVLLLKPINDVYYTIQPSLGLGYVAAIFLKHGHEVTVLHAGRERLSWDEFTATLQRERPDCVGIQMLSHEFNNTRRHVELIRQFCPETLVIVGGPHLSGDPETTMRAIPGIDFGFTSEAEVGLEKFLGLTPGERADPAILREVPNLVWRDGERIAINAQLKEMDLDALPFPAWSLMPPGSYPVAPHGNFCRQTPVAPLITSRGCPYTCTFCAGYRMTGRQVRFRSPANVLEEISLLYHEFGVREIHVEDEVFTLRRSFATEVCQRIIDSGMKLSFALPNGVRLDSLDEELLRLLERTGFYSMGVGIESGSDRVLELMHKNLNTDTIRRQVDLIKRVTRIHLTGFFILGYPTETEEEVLKTIEFAKTLPLDKANFMFLSPLPGSQVWEDYRKVHGNDPDWADTFSYRIVEGMTDIPPARMRQLHRKAVRDFYCRPKILLNLARQIKSVDQLKYISRRLANIFNTRRVSS